MIYFILFQSLNQLQFNLNWVDYVGKNESFQFYYSELIKDLLINYYASDLNDVDYQKYLSDRLVELIGIDNFIEFANVYVVDSNKIEGMLYTYINVISTLYSNATSIDEMSLYRSMGDEAFQNWIKNDSTNQRLINKINKFQSLIQNY